MAQKPNSKSNVNDKPITQAPKLSQSARAPPQSAKSNPAHTSRSQPAQSARNPPVQSARAPPGNQPPPPAPNNNVMDSWMDMPKNVPNCPTGLEYLSTLDQLLVEQKIDLAKLVANIESNYEFYIRNHVGQHVYHAIEDTNFCVRNCLNANRPFHMGVFDTNQREVIHFYRPCRAKECCFFCCLQKIEVSASGELCGTVAQEWNPFLPRYRIKDHLGETVMRIEGPFFTCACLNDVNFRIVSLDGLQVGLISKKWSDLFRELYTSADIFGITFPVDLDVRMKAVMLGACMLINVMYYEDSGRNKQETHPQHASFNLCCCLPHAH